MNTLLFEKLSYSYRPRREVLREVDLRLEDEEVVGLLGRNGAGKTTLMRLALGTLIPSSGSIQVFGLDPVRKPVEVKRQLGYVSEEQILPPALRVEDVLRVHARLYPDWDAALATDLRKRLELGTQPRVRELSKGQARRLALLCALAHRPRLLLLDEPTGGLDPAARREFLEIAIGHLAREGGTMLFSTHQVEDLERLAGRVAILHQGRILRDAPPGELTLGHSLVHFGAETDRGILERLPGFAGIRRRATGWQVLLELEPREAEARLRRVGLGNAPCVSPSLEDFFVELVGAEG